MLRNPQRRFTAITDGIATTRRVDRALHVSLTATACTGIVIALAALLPAGVAFPALVAVGAAWAATIATASVLGLARLLGADRSAVARVTGVVGAGGIVLAALTAGQQGLVRLFTGRPALVWGIDWRAAWNHARAVARHGGVGRALDYAGEPISYHVGPAWPAAAVERMFGGGLAETLFTVVPALCVLAVAAAVLRLGRDAGLSYRQAAAAVALAFALPGFAHGAPTGVVDVLGAVQKTVFSGATWMLVSLHPSSLTGLAVGLAGAALLLDRRARTSHSILGAAAIASVVAIKPQYFVGIAAAVGCVVVLRLGPWPGSRVRDARLPAAALAAIFGAVAARAVIPGFEKIFMSPHWAPDRSPYTSDILRAELGGAPALVIVAAVALAALVYRRGRSRLRPGPGLEYVIATLLALALASAALFALAVPVEPELVSRARELGLRDQNRVQQGNLLQILIVLRFLLTVCAFGVVVALVPRLGRRAGTAAALFCGLLVLGPAPYVARGFVNPDAGYLAAEDPGLYSVLQTLPRAGTLLVSSDLADPAEDYRRAANAPLLTAYAGHAFYVSNLRYVHWTRRDAPDRLRALHTFFGAEWSAWHDVWLARTGVTHVLVDDRCRPRWWNANGLPLRIAARDGAWTAFAVVARAAAGADATPAPSAAPLEPRYGRAACLPGRP